MPDEKIPENSDEKAGNEPEAATVLRSGAELMVFDVRISGLPLQQLEDLAGALGLPLGMALAGVIEKTWTEWRLCCGRVPRDRVN